MDNPCGFSKDKFLAVLKQYGPDLSAHEVASLAKVSVRQVLCAHHHNEWEIEAFAGDFPSWKYRKRHVLDAKGRAIKEVGQYNDAGLSHSGKRAVLRKENVNER